MKNIEDIQNQIARSSSNDGESLNFELKGCTGQNKFLPASKKLLAKEICAFANTYGGTLCYHYGADNEIKKFPEDIAKSLFERIEGWLRDSLEPKLLGINIEIIDNIFLITVPESKTKPHCTSNGTEYYYRHSTISQKMPEIMISSMYRSQDYLNFTLSATISKIGKQLSFSISIQNHSNISGSKPKVQIQLFSNLKRSIDFFNSNYFDKFTEDSFMVSSIMSTLKITRCCALSTNFKFSEKILYPQDNILLSHYSKQDDDVSSLKYILIRADCMFKESIRKTEYTLVEFDDSNNPKILTSTKKDSKETVIVTFNHKIRSLA